jgi:hypothetical protein
LALLGTSEALEAAKIEDEKAAARRARAMDVDQRYTELITQSKRVKKVRLAFTSIHPSIHSFIHLLILSNTRSQANKYLRVIKTSKRENGFGFTISGGIDVDGGHAHISHLDEGLHCFGGIHADGVNAWFRWCC